MKNVIVSLAAVAALVSSVSFADDVSLGAHVGSNDQRYYDVGVSHDLGASVVLGGRVETQQVAHNSVLNTLYSANLGYKVAAPLGFNLVPAVEYGTILAPSSKNTQFFGAGVSVDHGVYGPVSVSVAYRYRSSFGDNPVVAENRETAAVSWALDANNVVSVVGHTYSGNETLSKVLGVNYTHRF